MAFHPDQLRAEYDKIKEAVDQGSLRKDANSRFSQDRKNRLLAGKGDHKEKMPVFLRPQDIQKGIDYGFEKVYLTTLGKGELRILTQNDLIAFKKNIDLLKDQYTKGITAKQVINLSLPSDIERCNKEIRLAIPSSAKDGVVHFITNASSVSDVKYHHVDVEFVAYKSLALQPSEVTIQDVRSALALGKIRFQCDCGKHTYWFRYMASIGGYNYGRVEEGFPKIRNPNLAGVACKHTLRVMQYILSPAGSQYLFKTLSTERSKQFGKRRKVTVNQANKMLDEQLKISENDKTPQVKQNTNARDRELQRRATALERKHQAQVKRAYMKQHRATEKEAQEKVKQNALSRLDVLLRSGVITKEQYNLYSKGAK